MPGIVETKPDGSQTLYAQSLGWPAVPISSLISHDLPVYAENGTKTEAKAEQSFGAARGVTMPRWCCSGAAWGLASSRADSCCTARRRRTEWGHTKSSGADGCAAAAGAAAWRPTSEPTPSCRRGSAGGRFDGSGWRALGTLLEAAERGDPAAVSVVDDIVASLGTALGSLVNLTNPQRVVIEWLGRDRIWIYGRPGLLQRKRR